MRDTYASALARTDAKLLVATATIIPYRDAKPKSSTVGETNVCMESSHHLTYSCERSAMLLKMLFASAAEVVLPTSSDNCLSVSSANARVYFRRPKFVKVDAHVDTHCAKKCPNCFSCSKSAVRMSSKAPSVVRGGSRGTVSGQVRCDTSCFVDVDFVNDRKLLINPMRLSVFASSCIFASLISVESVFNARKKSF